MGKLPLSSKKREEASGDFAAGGENVEIPIEMKEKEQILLALLDQRSREVERNKWRLNYHKAELEESQKRLVEEKIELSCYRCLRFIKSCKETKEDGVANLETGQRSDSHTLKLSPNTVMSSRKSQGDVKSERLSHGSYFLHISEGSSKEMTHSKPKTVIDAINKKPPQLINLHTGTIARIKASNGSGSQPNESFFNCTNSPLGVIEEKPFKISFDCGSAKTNTKGTKRKFEQKEGKDLVSLIGKSSSTGTIDCHTGILISSQHRRRLRSLALCPTNDQLFVTSSLDGVVNLWQVEGKGTSVNLLSSADCTSVKRRWPEDFAWHPHRNSLFSVYSADNGDSQVSVLDLKKAKERSGANFLEDKPHVKGLINSIIFMPWEDNYFVTGGSDHAVVLWSDTDDENKWKSKILHNNLHSSAVMGVAGMQDKQIVLSAGADKRIGGFDVLAGKVDYRHQIESKCMSVLPNPRDFNLFMVQTGAPGRQLRLFDYRLKKKEIHAFGWEQEASESQSALINQAWSPDGLYITSGSADPLIHIFDIRYKAQNSIQSIRGHHKRVFKAAWHPTLPLLISISSDLNIGLHNFK